MDDIYFFTGLFLEIFLKEQATLQDLRQMIQRYLIERIHQKTRKSNIHW
jgi:hypothetical protein